MLQNNWYNAVGGFHYTRSVPNVSKGGIIPPPQLQETRIKYDVWVQLVHHTSSCPTAYI